jgi:hypothetical protein
MSPDFLRRRLLEANRCPRKQVAWAFCLCGLFFISPDLARNYQYSMNTTDLPTFRRKDLERMPKRDLFYIYSRHFNDEMSPLMFKGLTIKEILDTIFDDKDEVQALF